MQSFKDAQSFTSNTDDISNNREAILNVTTLISINNNLIKRLWDQLNTTEATAPRRDRGHGLHDYPPLNESYRPCFKLSNMGISPKVFNFFFKIQTACITLKQCFIFHTQSTYKQDRTNLNMNGNWFFLQFNLERVPPILVMCNIKCISRMIR